MQDNYPEPYLVINRLYNSHVLNRLDSFDAVAKSLFGVQAQIPNASSIAYAIRTNRLRYSNYLKAFEDMKLVRLWGIRTTLHSYCNEDWRIVLSQVSTTENWFSKKMQKQGVDIDALVNQVASIIENVYSFDRNYLLDRGIPEEYLGPWGDLLIELNNRGYICCLTYGDSRKKEYKNTIMQFNDGHYQEIKNCENARHEIAIKYFNAYGPATIQDFAHWLGCSIRQACSYVNLIERELCAINCDGKLYYILRKDSERYEQTFQKYHRSNQCWLLPKFDPLLLAYADKGWIVEEAHQKKVWKAAGHVEGIVVQNWRAVATWKYKLRERNIDFHLEFFQENSSFNVKSLRKRCNEIAEFRGLQVGTISIKQN